MTWICLSPSPEQALLRGSRPSCLFSRSPDHCKTIPLEDLDLKNSTSLNAAVPWGLDPGVYTLTVTNPDAQSGSLAGAFTITQGFGHWTSDGPFGGAVTTLLVDPANTSTLYAALQSPTSPIGIGLFRSTDGGTSWEMILADISNQAHAADLSVSLAYIHLRLPI